MKAVFRPYHPHRDEAPVSAFLEQTYLPTRPLYNWLRPRWEYMVYAINGGPQENLSSFGLWHVGSQVVGMAHFESGPGEAFIQVHPEHTYLKAEMLDYTERNLCTTDAEIKKLALWINAADHDLEKLALAAGFVKDINSPDVTTQLDIEGPLAAVSLPAGFRLTDRAENNDLHQINRVLWRGFNHEGLAPEQYVAGRADVEKAPLYRPELTVMVQAPDGHLISYCGIWYVPANRIAYVEPVATDPDYRRRGLASAAVLEAIRRASLLGATQAIVGSGIEFYRVLGFRPISTCFPWHKWFGLCDVGCKIFQQVIPSVGSPPKMKTEPRTSSGQASASSGPQYSERLILQVSSNPIHNP